MRKDLVNWGVVKPLWFHNHFERPFQTFCAMVNFEYIKLSQSTDNISFFWAQLYSVGGLDTDAQQTSSKTVNDL